MEVDGPWGNAHISLLTQSDSTHRSNPYSQFLAVKSTCTYKHMQGEACICRDAERFKAWLNFFWRTGGALPGCSRLALPLKVIGSDSCILAVDHLLWHRRWSHWRQQCRTHTCTCQAYICAGCRDGGGVWVCLNSGQWAGVPFTSTLPRYTSKQTHLRNAS